MRYTFAGLLGGDEKKFRVLPGGGTGGKRLLRTGSKGGGNVTYMSITDPEGRAERMKWLTDFADDSGQIPEDPEVQGKIDDEWRKMALRSKFRLVKGGKRKPQKKK